MRLHSEVLQTVSFLFESEAVSMTLSPAIIFDLRVFAHDTCIETAGIKLKGTRVMAKARVITHAPVPEATPAVCIIARRKVGFLILTDPTRFALVIFRRELPSLLGTDDPSSPVTSEPLRYGSEPSPEAFPE